MVTETRIAWQTCTVFGRRWDIERPDGAVAVGVCNKCGQTCVREFDNRIFMGSVPNTEMTSVIVPNVHRKPNIPIGTVRRGKSLGYKNDYYFVWKACKDCGTLRWVQKMTIQSEESQVCPKCRRNRQTRYITGTMRV
jgi:hypothetical protein